MKNLNYNVPHFLVSGFDNGKKSLRSRFQSIFEDDKKKRGLIVIVVIIIIALLASSLFIFGDKGVEQVNDSLTVYIRGEEATQFAWIVDAPDVNKFYTDRLFEDYCQKYPDVKLNIVNTSDLNEEQYNKKLISEILAGNGPDVILGDESFMKYRSVDKMIRSSAFAELDEFIQADEKGTFSPENCFDNIMEYGRYKGSTYIIPILVDLPVVVTTKPILKKNGFNLENCTKDYLSFIDEAAKFSDRSDGKTELFFSRNTISQYMNIMGQTPTADNPSIDEEQFKYFAERYKKIYSYDAEVDPFRFTTTLLQQFTDNKRIFFSDCSLSFEDNILSDNNLSTLNYSDWYMQSSKESLVKMYFNQPNGDLAANITFFAAINKNSANKQNAYDFIKTLAGPYNSYFTNFSSISTNRLSLTYAVSRRSEDFTKEYMSSKINEVIGVIDDIDTVYCKSPITYEIQELMLPYYKDEATFEECFKQVQDKVSIYATE